jgi:hypothetical protein
MLWRENEGDCEPDIDDSLSQPLCEHAQREGRFLPFKIVGREKDSYEYECRGV